MKSIEQRDTVAKLGNTTQRRTTMTQGKAIPKVVHWIIIRLSTTVSTEDIAMYTDVSLRSVKKILSHFKQTGDVNVPKRLKPQLHRALCDYDIQVCKVLLPGFIVLLSTVVQHIFAAVNNMPDLYLDELRLELQETCGVSVSMSTIWRTLVKGGYSMKKVCYHYFL
jgi:transposase